MIDLSAREAHFADHLAPVWHAIPADLRGTFYVGGDDVAEHARRLGLERVAVGWPMRGNKLGPILTAAWSDLRVCSRTRRPVVLFEHGTGQSYGIRHQSYAGGKGRDRVALFVVPNLQAANRNLRYYPHIANAVVGSPRVDQLAELEPPPEERRTAAVSFHWRCSVTPEAGTAFDDFAGELARARRTLADDGIELLGHAHPRLLAEAAPVFDAAGIEVVGSFSDVVRRAHVYAVDNSSTLFEFAALGRPVVVLNAQAYRRDVAHGLRFWSEATVGINASAGQLADAISRAFDDPADVARSRAEAVARAYPVRDGTSALRAASAVVALVAPGRGCLVCGAAHSTCGEPTTIVPIDQRVTERTAQMGKLKWYDNPNGRGRLKLSDAAAARMGLTGEGRAVVTPPKPAGDVTNLGGAEIVSSETVPVAPVGQPIEPFVPPGAMRPAGPTQRARLAKAAGAADPDGEDGEDGDAADADGDGDPKDKKRPAPSRRRRAATPQGG